MSAASPMVLLLLLVAVLVGALMVGVAMGRIGDGIDLPARPRRTPTAKMSRERT